MKRASITFFFLLACLAFSTNANSQNPTISPIATFTDAENHESTDISFSGSAPIKASFSLNPTNHQGWNAHYEWRFYKEGKAEPYLVRYEENTEYIFLESGVNHVACYTTFINGKDTVNFLDDYWRDAQFNITVYESKLEFPNAFSPNGDGINDIYRAKPGYQSIIDFKAIIINRWGQKLYEWTTPSNGWDGTFRGKDVKAGTYYCIVKARGSDGREFNIKKDVNLMRDYIKSE